jgi:hypothetical protein
MAIRKQPKIPQNEPQVVNHLSELRVDQYEDTRTISFTILDKWVEQQDQEREFRFYDGWSTNALRFGLSPIIG